MCQARGLPPRRAGFTLIELLVVMALILAITALGIGYVVFSTPHESAVKGAEIITGALLNAKQRARRDGLPTGVRILIDPITQQAQQLQFIQQPEDYNQGFCTGNAPPPTSGPDMHLYTVLFNPSSSPVNSQGYATGVDFQGGAAYIGQIDESTVQVGDYFTWAGVATPHRINKVYFTADGSGNLTVPTLDLDSQVQVNAGDTYSIIRAPRRLPSEDIITLPPNLVIDNRNNLCLNFYPRTLVDTDPAGTQHTQPEFEILFAPSGGVVGQGTRADKVYLWLANPALPAGDPSSLILSVQIRTGIIGVYPVAPGADPYAYVRDPRASGL